VMEQCVDGEYQNFKAKGGAYTREHFFGKDPELKEMVANMSDEDIWRLNRGGHDARKVFAAYGGDARPRAADRDSGQDRQGLRAGQEQPKGRWSRTSRRSSMIDALRELRDRFNIPVSDEDLARCRSASRRGQRRDALPAARTARRSAATCRCAGRVRRHWCAAAGSVQSMLDGTASARSRPRWPSCASSRRAAQGQEHRQAHRADRAR
jgi:pyruvate dehydrogenase complex dehydrogenase (E1) component